MTTAERLSSSLPLPPALKRLVPDPGPVVAAVRLHGVITPATSPLMRGVINLAAVESALTQAFATARLQAVALIINSPGGSPTQSALVADRIRGLADENDVPVLAFCEDLAASGGYWLACAADEIIVHSTSLVGSIGVVSGGFGLDGLLERWGVERRLYTAGQNKARLDPFLPEKQDDVQWLRGMQDELHAMFVDWVKLRRGDRLAAEADVFTGEVWTGARAVQLGLADHLGTLRGVLKDRFPDAKITNVEPRKSLMARLGIGAPGAARRGPGAMLSILEAIEQRAAWSRFGL